MKHERAEAAVRRLIDEAGRLVIFTGAGISTECGIPDFRSPGGLWTRYSPIEFDDFMGSEAARVEAWRRKFIIDDEVAGARPGPGHMAVAELVRRGKTTAVVTQNIDGLHQEAGIADSHVVELHGNGTYARCLGCGTRVELAPIREVLERTGGPPACAECGGLLKSATVSFGQPMPREPMERAAAAFAQADAVLVLGSSLVVRPAADFPVLASRRGARLAIINRERTPIDRIADLVVHEDIGQALSRAVRIDSA